MTDEPIHPSPAAAPPSIAGSPAALTPNPAGPPRRSRAKIALIVIAVLVAVGVVAGTFAWRMTASVADAADRFLTTTAIEGPAASWAIASPAFQQSASASAWDAFARQSGLTGYKSSSWTNREISNNLGRVQGSVTTQAGATIPMTIELVRTGGKWLVQTVRLPQSGVQAQTSALEPSVSTTPPIGVGGAGLGQPAGSGASSSWQSPALPTPGGPGASPLSDSRSSMIPTGGASIPGAKVAGTCMTMLQEQTGLKFDNIECLSDLPARMGATTSCSIAKDTRRGQMTVTVTSVDQATQSVNFHCSAGSPM